MEYTQARSVITKLSYQIKILSMGIAGLLFCNAVLGLLLWHQSGRKELILIPAELHQEASITDHGVDHSYLEAMALMLVSERLNITPETVMGSNQNLLSFVDSRYYADFKKQLVVEAKEIQAGKITSSFYVNQVRSHPKHLTVTIDGQLKRWVGTRLIGSEPKRYCLTFSKTAYLLLLRSFQEIKLSGDAV